MIRFERSSNLVVEQPAEIYVTDDISIKFKEPLHISEENIPGVTQIIEQASTLLRTLELIKR